MKDHPDDVEHRGLHRVKADKVVELLVADDAEVDEEEDDERGELGGVVVGGEGPWRVGGGQVGVMEVGVRVFGFFC